MNTDVGVLGDVWSTTDGATWTQLDPPGWGARYGFGFVSFSSQAWLWGGIASSTGPPNNEVWTSEDGSVWNNLTAASWCPRSHMEVAIFQGAVFLVGGLDAAGQVLQDAWASFDGETWVELHWSSRNLLPWGARVGGQLVYDGSQHMYFAGGLDMSVANTTSPHYHNDIYIFQDNSSNRDLPRGLSTGSGGNYKWSLLDKSTRWPARSRFGFIEFIGAIWLFGGESADGVSRDVWSSTDGKGWTEHGNAPWAARQDFRVLPFQGWACVLGGYSVNKTANASSHRFDSFDVPFQQPEAESDTPAQIFYNDMWCLSFTPPITDPLDKVLILGLSALACALIATCVSWIYCQHKHKSSLLEQEAGRDKYNRISPKKRTVMGKKSVNRWGGSPYGS